MSKAQSESAKDEPEPDSPPPRTSHNEKTVNRLSPIAGIQSWIKKCATVSRLRLKKTDDELRNVIEGLIEGEKTDSQSSIAVHERTLISNILGLRDLPVVDIMVPRADIVAIDINTSKDALLQLMSERPHSRLPVYKKDLDNIVGILHMKDIVANIAMQADYEIKDIIREPLVVSPSMRVLDLLLQMRQSKVHIAFVIDEFGGIDGLITINDLIEAIVGEIDDEFDFEITPQLLERSDGTAIADARYPIEDFEARFGNVFLEEEEKEEVDTLGGLVCFIAGHVPARGEIITHSSGIEFEVTDADPRRVIRIRIRNIPQKTV